MTQFKTSGEAIGHHEKGRLQTHGHVKKCQDGWIQAWFRDAQCDEGQCWVKQDDVWLSEGKPPVFSGSSGGIRPGGEDGIGNLPNWKYK